jgi:hypothetical protein
VVYETTRRNILEDSHLQEDDVLLAYDAENGVFLQNVGITYESTRRHSLEEHRTLELFPYVCHEKFLFSFALDESPIYSTQY